MVVISGCQYCIVVCQLIYCLILLNCTSNIFTLACNRNQYTSYCNIETTVCSISFLKLVSAIFYEIFIFSPNDSPSKAIKNVFYSIKKALFILEIFKFL